MNARNHPEWKTQRLLLAISPSDKKKLKEIAYSRRMTMSEVLRQLLYREIDLEKIRKAQVA